MLFKITRTSIWGNDKPYDKCKKNGKYWMLDIENIQDLMNFQNEVKKPIIITNYGQPAIEIYDDYRE